jgi:RelE-like toxin of type II toxin-antitoxin system HigB
MNKKAPVSSGRTRSAPDRLGKSGIGDHHDGGTVVQPRRGAVIVPSLRNAGLSLTRDRKGQHSIRINDQWRICFVWRDGEAHDAEFADYH